ncbi:MAG TPA: hypothetical protein PLN18_02815 [Candidatus Colwellbacteria bacterium]|nr:hypothetical protein [Candidatus Colwellbacteria bacterium]HQA96274.1 hypothetical protein [Candidatus Colwellbacteria bacterium]
MKRILEFTKRFWDDPRPFQFIFVIFGSAAALRLAEKFWPETLFVILVVISIISLINTRK